MTTLLHLETTTLQCGVALSRDGTLLASRSIRESGYTHAEKLLPFIDYVFTESGISRDSLDGVCVSGGPGSYTGLRIGVSTAKGICHALNLPLIAVDTLSILASQGYAQYPHVDACVPMLDARRMEVYTRTFTENSSLRSEIEPLIVDENTSSLFSQYFSICFIGDGALKCSEFLGGEGRVFLDEYPCVESSIPLGHSAFISGNFVNLSSYEPNYLKAFQAGAAKDPFGLRKKLSL